ncbi:hypothetical protein ACU684_19590 [Pseudomonas sp. LF135]
MKVPCISSFLAATLLASVSLAAQADQTPTLWKVQVTAKTPAGPHEFVLTVPDGDCVSADVKDASGTKAALKVCMGNTPAPHTLYGWLITDPQEAAKNGDAKFEKGEAFSVGTAGRSVEAESSLYTVSFSKS